MFPTEKIERQMSKGPWHRLSTLCDSGARLSREHGGARVRTLVIAALLACGGVAQAADMLKPGDTFPAWTLVDQTGATVQSGDLAGKIYLLWFYPKAMTPGCTAEGQGLRDNFAAFRSAG